MNELFVSGPSLTLVKGEKRLFEGIITSEIKDLQGQTINPKGVVYDDFLRDGLVNWHHLTIGNPDTVIGKPKDLYLKGGDLWGVTELFKTKLADKVINLAHTLQKYKKRLSYSLEAQVLAKSPQDENYIEKSYLFGLAITPYPINKKSKIDLVKGLVFNEEVGGFQCFIDGGGDCCVKSVGEIKEFLQKALLDIYEGYKKGLVSKKEVQLVRERIKDFKVFL